MEQCLWGGSPRPEAGLAWERQRSVELLAQTPCGGAENRRAFPLRLLDRDAPHKAARATRRGLPWGRQSVEPLQHADTPQGLRASFSLALAALPVCG